RDSRFDQILDDFVLPVDGYRLAPGQLRQIDAMPLPLEGDIETVVSQSVALEVSADTHGMQQIDGSLLEDPRSHTIDHILAAAVLNDDGIDTVEMQQMPEHQARRTCADDADLCGETHLLIGGHGGDHGSDGGHGITTEQRSHGGRT